MASMGSVRGWELGREMLAEGCYWAEADDWVAAHHKGGVSFRGSNSVRTSIQLKLKVVVCVCNYVIFLANIFK